MSSAPAHQILAAALLLPSSLLAQSRPPDEGPPPLFISAPNKLTVRAGDKTATANLLPQPPEIQFIDASGERIEGSASFSHPRPVVRLKDVGAADVQVDGESASITITGSVTDAIADIVEGGKADIRQVIVEFRDLEVNSPLAARKVPVTSRKVGEGTALRPYPFQGDFKTTVRVPLFPGPTFVTVRAANLIGLDGYDSFSIVVTPPEQGASTSQVSKITGVVNHGGTLPGLATPVRVRVVDPSLDAYADSDKKIRLTIAASTEEFGLHFERDGVYLDRPLMAVTRGFVERIPNLFRADQLQGPIVARYGSVQEELSWSYTSQSPPNYYKYAAGTSVYHTIWDPGFRAGKIEGIQFQRMTPDGRWELDDSQISADVSEVEELAPGSSTPGLRLKLRIRSGAYSRARAWRCVLNQAKKGDPGPPRRLRGGPFEVVPLKTVIIGVDGLAYDAYDDAVRGHARTFASVFGRGVNAGRRVLSAIPTITWCNWPGIFSGMPPKDHGILGNSFFERDRPDVRPLNSASRDFVFVGFNPQFGDTPDSGTVAALGSLNTHAKSTAGSLYDSLAAIRPGPFLAYSVHHFYSRAERANVEARQYPFKHPLRAYWLQDHDAATAERLDRLSGEDSQWYFAGVADEVDVLSVYFPGPDNVAHAVGAMGVRGSAGAGSSGVRGTAGVPSGYTPGPFLPTVDVPLTAIRQHLEQVTDANFKKLVDEVAENGYLSATLFALTADHGLHAYHNATEFVVSLDRGMEKFFQSLGLAMWRGQVGSDWASLATVVYAPNGGMGQIYLREPDRTWQQPPRRDTMESVARQLYIESTGGTGSGLRYPYQRAYRQLAPKKNSAYGNALDRGALGNPPAIFVRVWPGTADEDKHNHFEANFSWVKAVDPQTGAITYASLHDFLVARGQTFPSRKGAAFDWPSFEDRIVEMNDKNPNGSRTGDILIFMDGAGGYLTINDGKGNLLPGWHGGATVAESYVPLILNIPGSAIADRSFIEKAIPPEGTLRNWHLTRVLVKAHEALAK